MHGIKKCFNLLGILVIFLFACQKEKDKQPPLITFTSPIENQLFNVNEDVHVTGTISDESTLTKAAISLLNEQGIPVHVAMPINVTTSTVVIDLNYTLDNIHLESGRYQLCVFASDGINDAYAYQQINLIAIPKVLKQIMVTTAVNASQTNLSIVDTISNMIIPFTSFSGDHLASSVNSYDQQFFHCGNYTGHFKGIDLTTNAVIMDVPPVIYPSIPYFTGFYSQKNRYYLSFYNEQIKGYDRMGSTISSTTAMKGFCPQHLCLNNNYFIVEQQQKITGEKKLVCYYPTGSAYQSCNLPQDVIAFCEKDDSHVFVFGNKSGQGIIQLFDREANNLWNPYPYALAPGTILSALKLDADTYLISLSNGTIYKYVYSISSVTPFLVGYTAVQTLLDERSSTLYVVEKNKISTFEYTTLKPLETFNSAEPILEVGLLYNR